MEKLSFGQCLRQWREYRGFSHEELAAQTEDVQAFWIRNYEANADAIFDVCVVDAYQLCKALGCTVEQLVEGIGPR